MRARTNGFCVDDFLTEFHLPQGGNPIDVGPGAGYAWFGLSAGRTAIDTHNPANLDGVVTAISLTPNQYVGNETLVNVRVGTFYITVGNDGDDNVTFKCRDSEAVADIPHEGATRTVSLNIHAGDYIGVYWEGSAIGYYATGGGNLYYLNGEAIDIGDEAQYTKSANMAIAIYGTGISS